MLSMTVSFETRRARLEGQLVKQGLTISACSKVKLSVLSIVLYRVKYASRVLLFGGGDCFVSQTRGRDPGNVTSKGRCCCCPPNFLNSFPYFIWRTKTLFGILDEIDLFGRKHFSLLSFFLSFSIVFLSCFFSPSPFFLSFFLLLLSHLLNYFLSFFCFLLSLSSSFLFPHFYRLSFFLSFYRLSFFPFHLYHLSFLSSSFSMYIFLAFLRFNLFSLSFILLYFFLNFFFL